MSKNASNIAGRVKTLIESTVNELGFSIWDIEYVKEGATWYLRITIDSEEGVDIDGCEKVHRAIDPILDENDPIEDAYTLEVSSPGIERVIRTPEHFAACVGEIVEVRLFKPVDGSKMFVGELGVNEDVSEITISANGKTVTFPRAAVAKANIYFEF